MAPLPLARLVRSKILGLQFVLFIGFLNLSSLLERNDVLPVHVILDVADSRKRGKEAFTAERCTTVTSGLSFVIFGMLENVVQIQFGEFLALLCIILIEPVPIMLNS